MDLGISYASTLGCIGINTGIGVKPKGFDDEEIFETLVENQKDSLQKNWQKKKLRH